MTATNFHDLDLLETCLKDLENTLSKIKNETMKTDFEAQIIIMKLKHEKLRAMDVVTKSRSILARMELMLAKTELGLEVKNLKENHSETSTANKKKSNVDNNESSSKKIKLSPKKKSGKDKTASRSSKSNKENLRKGTSPKKNNSTTPENVVKPLVPNNTSNSSSLSPRSLPCSVPLPNLTNSIWPVPEKKTIFLNNPPVRDTKVNKNIGYFSSAYAKEIFGYDPDTLPLVPQSNGAYRNGLDTNTYNCASNTEQVNQIQVNPAYNLSVTPGYNLSVMPGYIVQPKGQDNPTVNSDVANLKFDSFSGRSTPKITSSTSNATNDCFNFNDNTTNQLFRDLMCNKNNGVKVEGIRSLASIDTLVIATNNIPADFDNLSQEY